MSGDHTRFTFDPRRRFAAVLQQQGRVQLDSDGNEATDLQRERTRLLTLDTGGAAWMAETTPDAFLVGALAGPPPDLSLQPGRIYVDGRLAEIFQSRRVVSIGVAHQQLVIEGVATDRRHPVLSDLARRLHGQYNVLVLPGSFLAREAHGTNPGKNHVRIALVAPLEECVEAAGRIAEFCKGL